MDKNNITSVKIPAGAFCGHNCSDGCIYWNPYDRDTETGWIRIAQLKKSITNEQQPEQPVVEQPKEDKTQEQKPTNTETPVKEESKDTEKTTPSVKNISKTGYVDAEGLIVRKLRHPSRSRKLKDYLDN